MKGNPCKGCLLNDEHYYVCSIDNSKMFKHMSEKCPCKNCLVKGMCGYCCEPFLEHVCAGHYYKLEDIEEIKSRYVAVKKLSLSRKNLLIIVQWHAESKELGEAVLIQNYYKNCKGVGS